LLGRDGRNPWVPYSMRDAVVLVPWRAVALSEAVVVLWLSLPKPR
jgi:hypothetical protein